MAQPRRTRLWAWDPGVHDACERARDLAVGASGPAAGDVALLVAATAAARSDACCALASGSRLSP